MIEEQVKVNKTIIKRKGDFDLNKIYQKAKSWFNSKQYDFTEKAHEVEKNKEEKIKWSAEREITDYFKFEITSFFHCKIRRQTGNEVKIKINAKLILDHKDQWKDSELKSKLLKLYNNFIIKHQIIKQKEKLNSEFKDYVKLIKEQMGYFT